MHETVFASSLLNIILDEVKKHEAQSGHTCRVERIYLQLGLLTCLEEHTLRGCFEILAEDGPAAEAKLVVERLPLAGRCAGCGQEVRASGRDLACPLCRGREVDWRGGRESQVTSIEVTEI
ncbi:MAG: hydrogenase maturation nickel metallochaperone HypA [Deltaproteobacteria bacterium]|jgi:hydrogenase nickel incorporation protein HypA/HybF|nr:hydrogenase maturation nickel metallochaperone HypA [Deltaproteobacteria bacterium]